MGKKRNKYKPVIQLQEFKEDLFEKIETLQDGHDKLKEEHKSNKKYSRMKIGLYMILLLLLIYQTMIEGTNVQWGEILVHVLSLM